MASKSRRDVMLTNVRLRYCSFFDKKAFNPEDTGKYDATLMIEEGSENHKKLKKIVLDMFKEAWGADAEMAYKKAVARQRAVIHSADEKPEDSHMEGNVYVNSSSEDRPLTIDKGRKPVAKEDNVFYPGCLANIKLSLYTYEFKGLRSVGVELKGAQFAGDGEALGGTGASTASVDDFPELEDEGTVGGDWADDSADESDDWNS